MINISIDSGYWTTLRVDYYYIKRDKDLYMKLLGELVEASKTPIPDSKMSTELMQYARSLRLGCYADSKGGFTFLNVNPSGGYFIEYVGAAMEDVGFAVEQHDLATNIEGAISVSLDPISVAANPQKISKIKEDLTAAINAFKQVIKDLKEASE